MASGKAWKYGDDVNTDVILPGRYLDSYEPEYLKSHAMEDLDPGFSEGVRPGDIVVGGKNFGCGSSREQAATCLVYSGVTAVVAKSFARIFFRNAINSGLAVIENGRAAEAIQNGDEVEVDLQGGIIKNLSRNEEYKILPLPPFIMGILEDGGLIPHLKRKLGGQQ
ncbi:MAG TPA: 3-isopropylmalate dehydratase small subunit [Euryarchaeota archaeon]|nr:3-isopropylmalate dehydratase small subunit [Euryarchaeota archaeon]